MSINLADEIEIKTKKGKLGAAKQIFLDGDTTNLQKVHEDNQAHFGTLDNRSSQMEESIKNISVTGGASVADAVTYDNTTSGLESVNIKGAVDELAAKNQEQDATISTKAEKSEVATELDKKFDKENIAQEFGDSEDKVVSQFALPFRRVENSKYLYAIVDVVNHFIAGVQKDGSIEWSKGIPTPIRVMLEAVIKQAEQNKLDIAENLSSLNKAITDLNKTTIKNEDGSVVETPLCYKQSERFVYAKTDADGKMLLGFKKNGQPVFGVGVPEQIQEGICLLYTSPSPRD